MTFLREAGAFGDVLFIVLFALGEMLAIPSVLFILAAGLVWPFPLALDIAWLGSIVSAGVVFLVSHYLVRDFVQARLSDRLHDLDASGAGHLECHAT